MKNVKKINTDSPRKSVNKAFTVIGSILCVILLPILCINIWLLVQGYLGNDVPNAGGYYPLIVQSGSMEPEIMTGDLIINHVAKMDELEVGDVVSYYEGKYLITHRIVEETMDENGNPAFICQGDANNTPDDTLVTAENLAGVYLQRIPKLGDVAMFMQTTQGLIVCVICPTVLLLLYDFLRRRKIEKAEQKETEELREEIARLKAEKKKKEE